MPPQFHSWKMDPVVWVRQELQGESNKSVKARRMAVQSSQPRSPTARGIKTGGPGSEDGDQHEAASLSSQHNAHDPELGQQPSSDHRTVC